MHLRAQKPVLLPFQHWAEIEKLSKAALMDLAWSFATRCCGQYCGREEDDDSDILSELRAEAEAVLCAPDVVAAVARDARGRMTFKVPTVRDV